MAKKRKRTRAAGAGKRREAPVARESGPRGWLIPILESSYARLAPRDAPESSTRSGAGAPSGPRSSGPRSSSRLLPGGEVLGDVPVDLWTNVLAEYKRRKVSAVPRSGATRGPIVPGHRNWAPLGPSVVLHGQAHGFPSVGGRVSGIAPAANGRLYAASANGGAFRSDDGGMSWRALMDAFDLDPTEFASTSLACGAIAVSPRDADRVYVGTGEGDTWAIFSSRIVNALPAYRGIGPIRSDDGGGTWKTEPVAAGSPSLAGQAFFALAVDPGDGELVVGATTGGLYRRRRDAAGNASWSRVRPGVHSSVVVGRSGTATRFYAAEWGRGVVTSTDGATWTSAGTGFPQTSVGRIALGMRPSEPEQVYAFVADDRGAVHGVYRLDRHAGAWAKIAGVPDVLPTSGGSSQGDYDLAIAVDPADANLVYLGGSYFADNNVWPASVWRCRVETKPTGLRMSGTSIGTNAHADVHVLVHAPGDPDTLYVGCDGGIFKNRNPRGAGTFGACNNGLSCLCTNFFAQHPTDPGIVLCGLQDNGTARASGSPAWEHVCWGDGGYCAIDASDPMNVLVFANGSVFRATDGGVGHNSWSARDFPWALMTEPIVSAPRDPKKPATSKIVALGSALEDGSRVVYLSTDFGATWPKTVTLPTQAGIYALAFSRATRLFAGTTAGEVFRLDRRGTKWSVKRIDDVAAGPLGLRGLVSDIAVDWTDKKHGSVYVSFGGVGDRRHVWHFDGTRWEARSGPAGADNLLDVEHNAVVVDPVAPDNVYVGADIGVWHSTDRGQTWRPLADGLPDAPVFDLQVHPAQRLLRASTHGRGLYELRLDG